MTEKFTVIEGGKNPENNPLFLALDKISQAIEPFTVFDDMTPELSEVALYCDMSDSELAYEAELLSSALKNPGTKLGDLLERAVALRESITFRISS